MYECKWYNIPAKDAKDLMLIVYRSAISLKLTAGIFGNFSLELFGIVRYIYEKIITFYMQLCKSIHLVSFYFCFILYINYVYIIYDIHHLLSSIKIKF